MHVGRGEVNVRWRSARKDGDGGVGCLIVFTQQAGQASLYGLVQLLLQLLLLRHG